jgi:predicted DsbA family dithiol-disulfide isomerase
MERHPLDIAFISDIACPWCAIGLDARATVCH